MSYVPTPEQALELIKRYNTEPFHIQHAETVGKVMGHIAGSMTREMRTTGRRWAFCTT